MSQVSIDFIMSTICTKECSVQSSPDYPASLIQVGSERVLYITIPYRGCTQHPRCLFCGVQEAGRRDLKIDRALGDAVYAQVKKLVDLHQPSSLVLYNGGNILRPAEMFEKTIVSDVPGFVARHASLQAYELEARADDIIRQVGSLRTIQTNLTGKKLRIRLGIEFCDDELLRRHRKGISVSQIEEAVALLNDLHIEWNGYALLGGLDLNSEKARAAAVQTGRFMLDKQAYKVSINGLFATKRIAAAFGQRIYVPDFEDLRHVLENLCVYRKESASSALFKVGFEEEMTENVLLFPYAIANRSRDEISCKLQEFKLTQDPQSLLWERS